MFTISAPAPTIFEGRVLTVRVDESSDPDGDTVQFDIRQTGGADATFLTSLAGSQPEFYLEAPEILEPGATEALSFEIIGSDGFGNEAVREITINVRDDELGGVPIVHISPDTRLFAEAYSFNSTTNATPRVSVVIPFGDQAEIAEINPGLTDSFGSFFESDGSINYHPDDIILPEALQFNGVQNPSGIDYFVLSRQRNSLEWYTTRYLFDDGGSIIGTERFLAQSESFNDPCALVERTDSGNNFAWVGMEGDGLAITNITGVAGADAVTASFDIERLQTIGTGRHLCFLHRTRLPQRYVSSDSVGTSPAIVAVDYLNKELFVAARGFDGLWKAVDIIPLELQGNTNLEIVDVLDEGGPSVSPRSVAILLSDGIDGGDHRVIVLGQGNGDEFYQLSYQWTGGAPIKLLRGPFAGTTSAQSDRAGNQFKQDLIAISDSPDGNVVLRNISPMDELTEMPVVFAQPEPFEFAPGASGAITTSYFRDDADPMTYANFGIVATFPEDRSLRFFGIEIE